MPTYEVRIEPLEPLLFGDHRSARAGLDHLQRDQDPSPLTLHGAIGQFLADRSGSWPAGLLGEEQKDVLNPQSPVAELLGASVQGAGGDLYFPRPRHLRCTLRKGKPRPADLVTPGEDRNARVSLPWPKLLLPVDEKPLDDEAEGDLLVSETALERVLCDAGDDIGFLGGDRDARVPAPAARRPACPCGRSTHALEARAARPSSGDPAAPCAE